MRNAGGNGNQSGQPAPAVLYPLNKTSTGTVVPVTTGNTFA